MLPEMFDFLMELFLDWDDIEDYSHLVQDDPVVLDSVRDRVHLATEFDHLRIGPVAPLSFSERHNLFRFEPKIEWDGIGIDPNTPRNTEPSGYSSYEEYEYEMWKNEQVGGGYTDETLPLDYSPMS